MRLNQYLSEKENIGLGITFIDLDETLFNTFAKINVIKDGKVIRALSNSEFNAYKIKDGESFDFEEFRSSKLFYETSKPIEKMVKRAARIIKHTEVKGSKVIILTARRDLDNKELFLEKFRQEGIPIDQAYVERAGNKQTGNVTVWQAKKEIILSYLNTGLYRRTRVFDDFLTVCKEFLSLGNSLPKEIITKIRKTYDLDETVPDEDVIQFESWHVQDGGTIRSVK